MTHLVIDKKLTDMSQLETKLELLVTMMNRSEGVVNEDIKWLVQEIIYEFDR